MIAHANIILLVKLVKKSCNFKRNTLQKNYSFQHLCVCRYLSIKTTEAQLDVALLYSGEELG